MKDLKAQLVDQIKGKSILDCRVVVMPHFCLDHFVYFDGSFEVFVNKAQDIADQGGGNLVLKQQVGIGGKAANCAVALAKLDVPTHLIARTNETGFRLLEGLTKNDYLDISHVQKIGDLATTTTLELQGANIMLSDPGSLSNFGPELLTEDEKKLITEADIVCISDWGLNEKGTQLAAGVFDLVKKGGNGKTFFDPGDPSPKGSGIENELGLLKKDVLEKDLVDILSVNESEIIRYGGEDYLRKMARVDLHTREHSMSIFAEDRTEEIPAFSVQTKRLTGAGDAWNAGDIFGAILGLSSELRLLLANATAAYYISHPLGNHPSRENLMAFLEGEQGAL